MSLSRLSAVLQRLPGVGRRCIRVAVFGLAALACLPAPAAEIRLIYVGPMEGSVWKGIQQGLSEANALGRFTGQTYYVETVKPEDFGKRVSSGLPVAVLASVDEGTLLSLSSALSAASIAVLNLTNESNELRTDCRENLLHIAPSAAMKADAVAQWKQNSKAAQVEARAWHNEFVKFAGRELNNRFRKAQNAEMDDDAWASWAAMKMLADGVAQGGSAHPEEVLLYLREDMEFDGQKGEPHSFRETGQLRQPLLIVEDGKLAGEAPVRGVSNDLDSLGPAECGE